MLDRVDAKEYKLDGGLPSGGCFYIFSIANTTVNKYILPSYSSVTVLFLIMLFLSPAAVARAFLCVIVLKSAAGSAFKSDSEVNPADQNKPSKEDCENFKQTGSFITDDKSVELWLMCNSNYPELFGDNGGDKEGDQLGNGDSQPAEDGQPGENGRPEGDSQPGGDNNPGANSGANQGGSQNGNGKNNGNGKENGPADQASFDKLFRHRKSRANDGLRGRT